MPCRGQVFNASFSLEGAKAVSTALRSWCNTWYGLTALLCLGVHVLVMAVRAHNRSCGWTMNDEDSVLYGDRYPMCRNNDGGSHGNYKHSYETLSWVVWLFMAVLPLLGVVWGGTLNKVDYKSYRRYMQFLRLEFDTKLGMHSPR